MILNNLSNPTGEAYQAVATMLSEGKSRTAVYRHMLREFVTQYGEGISVDQPTQYDNTPVSRLALFLGELTACCRAICKKIDSTYKDEPVCEASDAFSLVPAFFGLNKLFDARYNREGAVAL